MDERKYLHLSKMGQEVTEKIYEKHQFFRKRDRIMPLKVKYDE